LKSEPKNIKQGYTNSKILDAFSIHNQLVIVNGLSKLKRIEDEDKLESLFTIEDKNTIQASRKDRCALSMTMPSY
jgi:hypothetical protein